jgi:ferredoxin
MTYLVIDNCIKCKHTDCVTVCPVDCFYEGEDMLVINPDECIDCGVCVAECPVDAIVADNELQGAERTKWLEINTQYSYEWPQITEQKSPLPDAEKYDGEPNKYEKYFTPIGAGPDIMKDTPDYD